MNVRKVKNLWVFEKEGIYFGLTLEQCREMYDMLGRIIHEEEMKRVCRPDEHERKT